MDPVTGEGMAQLPASAPKGRRFAAAVIDLILIPVILGVIIGLMLLQVPDALRSVILIVVNVGWLIFRDSVYSPGRAMVGLRLISLTGPKVTIAQALIRNILIAVPFILLIGYIVELVAIIAKGERVADSWAKTRVTLAA